MGKVNSRPDPVPKVVTYGAPERVKIATSNLFVEPDTPDVEYMTGLVFEDIGAMELSNFVRYDQLTTTDAASVPVDNIATAVQQTKLDFNLKPQEENSIDLNDYTRKNFQVNLNIIAVSASLYGVGTAAYAVYYVNEDLSEYSTAMKLQATITGVGSINATTGGGTINFDGTKTIIEFGNGYFKTGSTSAKSLVKTRVSGTTSLSDYVPVYYESSLKTNNALNDNYSNIVIEIADNYENYELEVEFVTYDDLGSA